ncbi:hypothetical protein CSKR_104152 [Clonorchis sinensis]|uniref:Uncharacterized protein n=1 Tax=Clonorchis sinensis TaxID=79923 RepID=A0A419PFN3_CLOSI|nr:hypothetical protein CSKR_104152 [Clonorchis sinensis]
MGLFDLSKAIPVASTFFDENPRSTTKKSISYCLITDSPTQNHTTYSSATTSVAHLKVNKYVQQTSIVHVRSVNKFTGLSLTSQRSVNVRTPNNGERNDSSAAWVAFVPSDGSLVILIGQNAARALRICAMTSSVTLRSELMQLPLYAKRSTNSYTSPGTVSCVSSDCIFASITSHFVGARCIQKGGMTSFSSCKNTGDFLFCENDVCIFLIDEVFVRR